jgi:transketolase
MLGETGRRINRSSISRVCGRCLTSSCCVRQTRTRSLKLGAWRCSATNNRFALVFTRQKLPVIDRTACAGAEGVAHGAYILADCPQGEPQLVLMASGSEVHVALGAFEKLTADGVRVRVLSFPSWELFQGQLTEYRKRVLPPGVTARIAIEAGATLGWERYVGQSGRVIGIDRFGASAPGDVNQKKFGFTVDHVVAQARELLS